MAKLHEILAVDRDLESRSRKVANDVISKFTKRTELFVGFHKQLNMFNEERREEEAGQEEIRALTTTVDEGLDYAAEHLIRHLDCLAQKEGTNQNAKGTVMVNGTTLLENVPATLLLALESKLKDYREIYEAIPTLAPQIEWKEDPSKGEGIWRAVDNIVKHKTEKTIKPIVLYAATKEHPAQIEKVAVDVPVGDYVTVQWSGMISPARKSELLGRIDTLIHEIKKARQRANTEEVIEVSIGKKIFDFING